MYACVCVCVRARIHVHIMHVLVSVKVIIIMQKKRRRCAKTRSHLAPGNGEEATDYALLEACSQNNSIILLLHVSQTAVATRHEDTVLDTFELTCTHIFPMSRCV